MIWIAIGVWGALAVVAAVTLFRARWWGVLATMGVAAWGMVCVLGLPVGDEQIEGSITIAAFGSFLLMAFVLFRRWNEAEPNWGEAVNVVRFLTCAMVAAVIMPVTLRQEHVAKLSAAFSGQVTKVYRSSNHQMPTVEVAEEYGHVTMENVDLALFERVKVGDRLEKETLHERGRLNGEAVRVVRATWFWRGKDAE